jgi:hypothetical protein
MVDAGRKPEGTVGIPPLLASNQKGTTRRMRTPESKTRTAWKRIGRIERHLRGVRISFTDLVGVSHLLYMCQRDIQRIIKDRVACDVVKIEKMSSGERVIRTEGQAYRSRSGQALFLRIPGFTGAEVMAPWKSFLAMLEGLQQAAPLSVLQKTERAENQCQQTTSTLPRGLSAGWF